MELNEEDKKARTDARRIIRKSEYPIKNSKSFSRQDITQLRFVDTRKTLEQRPLIQAKERRQKIINNKREERVNQSKKKATEAKNPKQLLIMMKELTQALNSYMTNTSEEIENIKKIIEANYKVKIRRTRKMN